MKIIIDIPEDALKEMKTEEFISIESLDTAIECIKNGTPLDDVKAEIDRQEFTHHEGLTHWYMIPSKVKSVVFKIIDKYKGVSDVKDIEVVPRKIVEMIIEKCIEEGDWVFSTVPQDDDDFDYFSGYSYAMYDLLRFAQSLLKQFEEDKE